jgi:hypothetical protein
MIELITHTSEDIQLAGLVVGAYSFFTIIIARWVCIAGEYYISKKLWIGFLIIGIGSLWASLYAESIIWGTILGITGFIYIWGIHEIIEQEERVAKGWYPKHPKKL